MPPSPFCDTSMGRGEINISACSCLTAPPSSVGIPPQRMGNRDGKIVTPVVVITVFSKKYLSGNGDSIFFFLIDLVSSDVQKSHTHPPSHLFSALFLLEKTARVNQLISSPETVAFDQSKSGASKLWTKQRPLLALLIRARPVPGFWSLIVRENLSHHIRSSLSKYTQTRGK